MELDTPLESLKGVGPELSKKLSILGLGTVSDVIYNFPRRYDDYSQLLPIASIRPGVVSIQARVISVKGRYVRRGLHITEAVASDESGSVRLVWFNQPYREASIKTQAAYFISGNFEMKSGRLALMSPSMELVSDFPINTARIVPIYRETKGLKSTQLRKILRTSMPLIKSLSGNIPASITDKRDLIGHSRALQLMHFPDSIANLNAAQKRLGFEEIFCLALASLLNKLELSQEVALAVSFREDLAKSFVSHLPFKLTDAQRRVIWQIYQDIGQSKPMNRLVEGDVGSGKTVVAAMAALMVMEQGYQVAFMAPTELLARQHADTVFKLLEPLGYSGQVGLLVGGLSPAAKKKAQSMIASGDIRLIVGTHALIQEKVDMHKLGLVIVDEQHRFGVEQRKALLAKAGHALHVLNMTATPIPRSLALTLYGELDISILDQKPAGRAPIKTKICSPNSRPALYDNISKQLEQGRQMFVVTPLISDSEVAPAASAEKVFEQMTKQFKKYRVGLMHGKLKADEKNAVMEKFVAHELDILVSTTVIEVGVDVPNATVMLIENAERFGLAQIHQLRGRVGRSSHQGYCFLVMGDSSAPSRRLRALESSSDGFALAELDLDIRGPGAIYGTSQHGQLDLRVAKLSDTKLIMSARQAAVEFIEKGEDLVQYPELANKVMALRAVTNLN